MYVATSSAFGLDLILISSITLTLQVVILVVPWQPLTVRMLKFIVLIQFAIWYYRIIPAYKDATRSSDMLLIYTWFAAAFNLVMYTLASNVSTYYYIMITMTLFDLICIDHNRTRYGYRIKYGFVDMVVLKCF